LFSTLFDGFIFAASELAAGFEQPLFGRFIQAHG
jgi:hypothetical protein